MHYAQPEEIPEIDALVSKGFAVDRIDASALATVANARSELAGFMGLSGVERPVQDVVAHFARGRSEGVSGYVLIAQPGSTGMPGPGLRWLEQTWPQLAQALSDAYDFPFHLVRIHDDPGETSFIPFPSPGPAGYSDE